MLPPDSLLQFPGAKKGLMPAEPLSKGHKGGMKSCNQLCRWLQGRRVIGSKIVHVVQRECLGTLHQEPVGAGDILAAHPAPEPGIPASGWSGVVDHLLSPLGRADTRWPGHIGTNPIRSGIAGQEHFAGQFRITVGIFWIRRMVFVNGQHLEWERGLTNAITMPQGTIAAGHYDPPHPGFNGSLHEIIYPNHIALKGNIKGETLGCRPSPQRGMVHWPGLRCQVLNGVDALDCLPAIVKHPEVPLDPGKCRKCRIGPAPRHQDEVVPLHQGADDKGTQCATRTGDKHFHHVIPLP
jgi:hypothetical protein